MTEPTPFYDFPFDLENPANAHAIELGMIPPNARVLDVGCHSGQFGEVLKKKKNCFVIGIDTDDVALKVATTRLDLAFSANAEREGWSQQVCDRVTEPFDAILFGDVLEHTRDPALILKEARSLLKPEGSVIVSVPNVANLRVRLGLLFGKFDYAESGILDRTHLRFFTHRSADQMLSDAGFHVVKHASAGYSLPHWLIRTFPGLLAVQIVMRAVPK